MTSLEQTEKTADRIRDELLATLKELDRRRRAAVDWRHQARQHSVALAAIALSLILLAGFAVYIARVRQKSRRPRLMRERIRAAKYLWEHPGRLTGAERSLPAELGRKAALAVVTAAASRMAKQAARRAFR